MPNFLVDLIDRLIPTQSVHSDLLKTVVQIDPGTFIHLKCIEMGENVVMPEEGKCYKT